MRKKVLAALVLAALVLASVPSCALGAVKLTLRIWDETQLPVIQENVGRFNDMHEGKIEVTVEIVPWESYWDRLDADLDTRDAPDILWMNVYLPKYQKAGLIEPLDSWIEATSFDLSLYVEGRVAAYEIGGMHYAVPKGLDTVAVALNTEIFARCGVALPAKGWTWDEMRLIADRLKAAIAASHGAEYPIVMELDAQPSWMNFLYQNGGSYISETGRTVTAASSESKNAIQQVVDLMTSERMAPYSVLSQIKGADLFLSGQAAMVFVGSWKAKLLEESNLGAAGKIELIEMPSMAQSNASVMGGIGYAMSSRCADKDAAWAFIEYITSRDAESAEAGSGIEIPALIEAQTWYAANFTNIDARVFMEASKTGFAYPSNGNFDWTSVIDEAMHAAFSGEKSVNTALDDGAARAQAVLDGA